MDIQVKHNGTDITGFVESYNREHNICTGIGNITIEIIRTIGRTFDPWDEMDIYENGEFKVRYYVSEASDSIPKGLITLECQDKSKRLVDYFIPDTYLIDYPSYTRYWIEKFLAEAGISYSFSTSSQGQLLSNNTQLGLAPAYEQILTLLQMSGWYMYFSGSGVANIGSLETDLSSVTEILDRQDILSISRASDDKMLRNRALVLGAFDPYSMSYAGADLRTTTPWNYDSRDQRAIVISNSNIPNTQSALTMAFQILKEFARITVEKYITVWGARDLNIGDVVRVESNVWVGRGLVTTFGVSMDKSGLKTNLVLDQRCPRLFGFFDFGDNVYVGTYGDGIWKKHIRFDHTWVDFSAGLTNLEIVDMHINNGMFGAVTSSGDQFYTTEAGGWVNIPLESLTAPIENEVVGSGTGTSTAFSGLMARATIVDKITGSIKFGVDNSQRTNYGDYFIDYSGFVGHTGYSSGIMMPSGSRGWIVEYNTYTGASYSYPISYSGSYEMMVIDLENDGINDYVSVATNFGRVVISGIPAQGEFFFGTNPDYDGTGLVSFSTTANSPDTANSIVNGDTNDAYKWFFADNVDDHELVFVASSPSLGIYISRTTWDGTIENFGDIIISQGLVSSNLAAHESASSSGSSEIIREERNRYVRYIFPGAFFGITAEGTTFTMYKHILLTSDTNPLDISDSMEEITISIPVDFNFDPPPFPYEKVGSVTPFYFDKFMILLWRWDVVYLSTYYANTKMWFQVFDYESGSLGTATMEYEKENGGATITLFPYNETFQSIGYSFSTVPDDYHVLMGVASINTGSSVSPTGNIFPAHTYILSETTSAIVSPSAGLVNYGIHGIGTNAPSFSDNIGYISYVKGIEDLVFSIRVDTEVPENTKLVYNTSILGEWSEVDLGGFRPATNPFQMCDSMTGYIYLFAKKTIGFTTYVYLLGLDGETFAIEKSILFSHMAFSTEGEQILVRNVGNMCLRYWQVGVGSAYTNIHFNFAKNPYPLTDSGARFLVLQRDVETFHLIERENYPIRIDVSNNSPLWAVGSGDTTFVSNYIYGQELVQVSNPNMSGQPVTVEDFRYCYNQDSISGIMASSGIQSTYIGLFISYSGIYGADMSSYSGGFQIVYGVTSGGGNRLETSNYGISGQYMFVTTSGDFPAFWQKDPDSPVFTSYSGLPESRATIIRLDDYL